MAWRSKTFSLSLATAIAGRMLFVSAPGTALAQGLNRTPVAIGTKIADGQAYVTLVKLKHQPDASSNGRLLLAFEENGFDGIPIWESTDEGVNWHFIMHATDGAHTDHTKCNLHWQPHLTEMPRPVGSLAAGTILLSASAVCNTPADRGFAEQHLQLYISTDLGRTWQFRGAFADGTAELPVWEPHLQILDDGKLVEFYSDETHKADGYNQLLAHKVSTDGGKTWGTEIYDTAMKGGVERPGMVIVDRLPDKRYVYNFEDVAGPVQSQIFLKFSADGLNWGDPADRGTPVQTDGGAYPINCPTVSWFPTGGPDGVIVVSARGAAGGGDPNGRSFYWNNNNGVGPWWEVPAPVQKLMNSRSGWTQAMMLKSDGSILHITSSASVSDLNNPSKNEILFNAAKLNLDRYEAEDAARRGSALMRDASMSNGAKVRLGANDVGQLTFRVHLANAGAYRLAVSYTDIGFDASPRVFANGKAVQGTTAPIKLDPAVVALRTRDLGTRGDGRGILLSGVADLKAGDNTIKIAGGAYALDVDYLEVKPVQR
jgi:hypothetical protein